MLLRKDGPLSQGQYPSLLDNPLTTSIPNLSSLILHPRFHKMIDIPKDLAFIFDRFGLPFFFFLPQIREEISPFFFYSSTHVAQYCTDFSQFTDLLDVSISKNAYFSLCAVIIMPLSYSKIRDVN